jgi:hypothetical protein
MSDYANQLNIKIAEVARLTFNDIVQADGQHEEIRGSIEIVVHFDFLKVVRDAINQVIVNHEENLAKQVEANRKMN